MALESGGNAKVGTNTSGATGLMQVVGSIWQGTANKYGNGDLNDPWTNIRTGAAVLKTYYDSSGTWEGAVAHYIGSPVKRADGTYAGGFETDANGTSGAVYVGIIADSVAYIEQKNQAPPAGAPIDAGGYGNTFSANAIGAARSQLGTPYKWGGAEVGGFDCSGMIVWAYNKAGKPMARETSQTMFAKFQPIQGNELKAGDLIFYHFPGENAQPGANHVAMYIGNGEIIQSTSNGDVLKISPSNYGQGNIIGFRRVP
jgi:cell wall-associated NlpC family hydrolase